MIVGLFGGSFNPVHQQHLSIAQAARTSLNLDEVWFLPVFQPVHKNETALIPFIDRVRLLQAAIDDLAFRSGVESGFRVSHVEKDLGGPSFTIRTVRFLKQQHPGNEFILILGADSLLDFPTWKDHQTLLQEIKLAVAGRPGLAGAHAVPFEKHWIPLREKAVSSSEIRRQLSRGHLQNLPVPDAAMALIVSEGLYNCLGPFKKLIHLCREKAHKLPVPLQKHLEHVSILSAGYAAEIGEDPRPGLVAGLAHDLYRAADGKKIIKLALDGNIPLSEKEMLHPMLAHGAAAAGWLKKKAPDVEPMILEALRRHTLPRLHENALCRVLVMADALEPSRRDEVWKRIRTGNYSPKERFRLVVMHKRLRAARKRGLEKCGNG